MFTHRFINTASVLWTHLCNLGVNDVQCCSVNDVCTRVPSKFLIQSIHIAVIQRIFDVNQLVLKCTAGSISKRLSRLRWHRLQSLRFACYRFHTCIRIQIRCMVQACCAIQHCVLWAWAIGMCMFNFHTPNLSPIHLCSGKLKIPWKKRQRYIFFMNSKYSLCSCSFALVRQHVKNILR